MLVPSSFKYRQQPSQDRPVTQPSPSNRCAWIRRSSITSNDTDMQPPQTPRNTMKQVDVTIRESSFPPSPPSKPVSIPSRNTSRASFPAASDRPRHRSSSQHSRPSLAAKVQHQKDALPPSVAALLAMTAIPPPTRRLNTRSKPRGSPRRISIDELVQEWKQEASVRPTVGSHKSMDILLEDVNTTDESVAFDQTSINSQSYSLTNSDSSSSLPSLDLDNQSMVSLSDPLTPGNIRSSRASSIGTSKKTKVRSSPVTLDTSFDHPLDPDLDIDPELIATTSLAVQQPKGLRQKNSFRSNITLSLQSLKSRALSSLAQLHINSSAPDSDSAIQPYDFSDAVLWQNPFMFPRIGPEIRPQPFKGTPTKSERRYFNPTPLNFEEQQGHFRQALHAPLNLEGDDNEYLTMIQMKTYNRNAQAKARKAARAVGGAGPDPKSEAGRALASNGPPMTRQREPRENSDFLRVVVLEMNMRRGGKLEETMPGRAKIWLPPRQRASTSPLPLVYGGDANVPARWRSVAVDEH